MKKSVVRSLCYDSSLSASQLEMLFTLFKVGCFIMKLLPIA